MRLHVHDAIVVGSGATGGWAAKHLTEAGLDVLLLEAGPKPAFVRDVLGMIPRKGRPRGWARERQATQSCHWACDENTHRFFVDDTDNPYETPPDKPFAWIRGRQVGGRTLLWTRHCYRMSRLDFRAAAADGFGENWPIDYDELAPYYNRVERYCRMVGLAEGLEQAPDGAFVRSSSLDALDTRIRESIQRRWKQRTAIPFRGVADYWNPRFRRCPTCGQAPEGCTSYPFASSLGSTLHAALATGRLRLRANAVASHILLRDGAAKGVAYVDRRTGVAREAFGSVIVLCASTIESVRLLLNSGIPSRSGALGRFLMDHVYGVLTEGLVCAPSARYAGSDHSLYVPRFQNLKGSREAFLRGYGIQMAVNQPPRPGGPAFVSMVAFGEVLPRAENRVTLSSRKDAWGIPVARIECSYSENERVMALHQLRSMNEMADAFGLRVENVSAEMKPPGMAIHETGGARMGSKPSNSVVNRFNQCWDARNVFVTDGACFATSAPTHPTLTMMALTARACDYIVERGRRGEF